ncbi:flagellar filament capping protein FliD [Billgrantia saliphila]|uniref:flagellar filament capping protein FliD n=1 Tax=Billgrantia saliphila TaxID=1848458 RepID=UPI000CE5101E|nr:flagellar filament capping protein FliD [Halomonas saliphila]
MATISSLGIGSGLDLNGLLDQLNTAERGKLEPIERQIENQQVKISAYGELKGALATFQSAASALNDSSLYQSLSSSVSGDAVQAAAGEDATPGQYNIEVEQLAGAGSLATQRVENLDTALNDADTTLTLNFADSELDHTISIAADSTLEDVRDAINSDPDAAVTASIVNDGAGYRLSLMSKDAGEQAAITGTDFAAMANQATLTDATVVQAGQDARLEVNGIAITSASNQVEGAIQGVTLTVANEGSSSVVVEQDTRAVRNAISDFVEGFNALKGTIGKLTAFDAESGEAAELLGDSAVRSVESQLRSVLAGGVASEEGGFSMLSDIGISLKLDGTLEIDEQRLDSAIANQQDALSDFFAGSDSLGGLAGKLNESVTQLTRENGALGGAISGAESSIASLNERYTRMEQSIGATIERYRTQFGQLDGMIAQMNQTSDYLFQQFDMMNAQLGRE